MYLYFIKTALSLSLLPFSMSNKCIEESSARKVPLETPKGLKTVPVALIITTLGTDVRLPCHYCSEKMGLSGRIWRRRSLNGTETEVQLDMHDDPVKNRVFTVEDHSLIILKVAYSDSAYYFCYDVEDKEGIAKIDVLLDVAHRTNKDPYVVNMPADLEEEIEKWIETCNEIKNIPAVSQYVCYPEWSAWSKCDSCDKIGQRRRIGECRLQKLVKVEVENPQGNVIEADFPIIGVGCHSALLNDVPDAKEILNKIPSIVLIENCKVSCSEFGATKASRLKAYKQSSYLRKIKVKIAKKMKEVNKIVKAEIKEEKEGAQLTFFCPGASLDTQVKWKLNERPLQPEKLKRQTAGRVYLDATDALHIKSVRLTDAGEYICTLDDVEIGLVRLKVISKHIAFDPASNFGMLTITMTLSFILWIVLMAVRWKHFMMQRKVQQMRAQRKFVPVHSDESEASEEQSLLPSETTNETSTSTFYTSSSTLTSQS